VADREKEIDATVTKLENDVKTLADGIYNDKNIYIKNNS
jgi:hypothetical protein